MAFQQRKLSNHLQNIYKQIDEDPNVARRFSSEDGNMPAKLKAEYDVTYSEVARLMHYARNKTVSMAVTQTKVTINLCPEARGYMAEFMSHKKQIEKYYIRGVESDTKEIKAEDVHEEMCKNVAATIKEGKEGLQEPCHQGLKMPKVLSMNYDHVKILAGLVNDVQQDKNNQLKDDPIDKMISDTVVGDYEDTDTILDIAPEESKVELQTIRGKQLLLPGSFNYIDFGDTVSPRIYSQLRRVTSKGKYADICNKHLFGINLGAEARYIYFLVDLRRMIGNKKFENIIIHDNDGVKACIVSKHFRDSNVYFRSHTPVKGIRVNGLMDHELRHIVGLHIYTKPNAVQISQGESEWEHGPPKLHEIHRSLLNGLPKGCYVIALEKLCFVPENKQVSVSSTVSKGEVWTMLRGTLKGFKDRKTIVRIVASLMWHWYSYPFHMYPAKRVNQYADYIGDIEGTYDMRLTDKDNEILYGFKIDENSVKYKEEVLSVDNGSSDSDEEEEKESASRRSRRRINNNKKVRSKSREVSSHDYSDDESEDEDREVRREHNRRAELDAIADRKPSNSRRRGNGNSGGSVRGDEPRGRETSRRSGRAGEPKGKEIDRRNTRSRDHGNEDRFGEIVEWD